MKLLRLSRRAETILRRRRWYSARALGVAAGSIVRSCRPFLRRCEFIAVTGSCGKTTTKELIAGTLGAYWSGTRSPEGRNQHYHIAVSLLAVRPWHRFTVQEAGVGRYGPGGIDPTLALVRPTIGVVTTIGTDHISSFGSIEAIAREKRKVVEALPATGVAILNADDPLVLAMRDHCRARVLTYGLAQGADVRAEQVSAVFPDRLSFVAVHGQERALVQTAMCGEHWLSGALAAITVAVSMGLSLADAARAIGSVPPFANRMCPVVRDDGVTFVFDDAKTPVWAAPAAFAFVREARVKRRIIVVGTLADYMGSSVKAYRTVGREALRSADHVVFVGHRASQSLGARKAAGDVPLHAFFAIDAACDHLADLLEPGDLVLLKGKPSDGLEKIFATAIRWRRGDLPGAGAPSDANVPTPAAPPASAGWTQVVVGLGNHGERYRSTPHNVGYEVVDLLASFFGSEWTDSAEARVASIPLPGGNLHLVKARVNINHTGPALATLRSRLPFAADDLVLIHDDLNLEPGIVKARRGGNDGGHNGASSVLGTMNSIAIRRVKVGVGRADADASMREHVLVPMTEERLAVMRVAYVTAAHRVLTLLAIPENAHAEMLVQRVRFEERHPHTANSGRHARSRELSAD